MRMRMRLRTRMRTRTMIRTRMRMRVFLFSKNDVPLLPVVITGPDNKKSPSSNPNPNPPLSVLFLQGSTKQAKGAKAGTKKKRKA
jgi:hypothetical protein